MGHHPETLVLAFSHYESWLHPLRNWIGFDIWHIDPERRSEGQRSDDSCGWFDRRPREYADAVAYLLADKSTMHEVRLALAARRPVEGAYEHIYPRLTMSETLAVTLLVARELETRRWWNGQSGNGGAHASVWLRMFTRRRRVETVAFDLALNPIDNLSSIDSPEALVRLIAASLHRRFKPWWKHPRWHVHHWKINFALARNLKRMVQPCATCGKGLGFGYCPHDRGDGQLHHLDCVGVGCGSNACAR